GKFTLPFRGWQTFEPGDLTLAEWLWDKGYRSALVTDLYHIHKPSMTLSRGFDEVIFIRGQEYDPWVVDSSADVAPIVARHFKLSPAASEYVELWRSNFEQYARNISVRRGEQDYFIAQVVTRAIHWLERYAGQDRLFLWVDCFDPHEPWDPPEELKAKYDPDYDGIDIIDPVPDVVAGYLTEEEMRHVQRLYAAEVEFVDGWIGHLLDAARSLGYFENSLIIFTSDHGVPLNDHGIVRKCRPWNYEELAHVPLIVRPPGGLSQTRRVETFAQHPDLFPTICDFLAVPLPDGLTGRSFWPIIDGKTDELRDFAVSGHHRRSWAIRTPEWTFQLMLSPLPKSPAGPPDRDLGKAAMFGEPRELFDRQNDRSEQRNLIAELPEVADALELRLRRFMAGLGWKTHEWRV
ncbi:MAG: sulfatase, partial [Armatimonadetes bacterium]|nr:sulfatase [Armatimonadota bacterium]